MRHLSLALAGAALALGVATGAQGPPASADSEWRVYGGSNASDRYSPLREITTANVDRLEEAWRFDTGESGGFQVNPIVVHGVMYSPTPSHRVVALDAATGKLEWAFDSKLESRGPNRGVTYWENGDERRLFVAADQYLYALDASTGVPVPGFGDQGRLDLRRDLGRDPAAQSIRLTTPGIVYRGPADHRRPRRRRRWIVARRHPRLDVRTGALGWSFHTIPHPGEDGLRDLVGELVAGERRRQQLGRHGARRGARHRVRADRVGRARLLRRRSAGDNLFANCLLALDAATGKRSGTSSPCITTSGIATSRRRRRS